VGFLVANVRLGLEALRFLRRRSTALLTWRGPRPRYYGLQLALGVVLGLLLAYDLLVLRRPAPQLFGVGMMFVYYGYLMPLSRRIGLGFYADGIWSESGFVPYWKIGAVSWREGEEIALVIVSRLRNLARRLVVPGPHYAAARRLLRDKIAAHDIQLMQTGLELDGHDEREDV
jgi:xanthosine utilization system XapX-like protein